VEGTARCPAGYHQNRIESGDVDLVDETEYKSMVMSLMYLAKRTRPEILFSVAELATKTKPEWDYGAWNKIHKDRETYRGSIC